MRYLRRKRTTHERGPMKHQWVKMTITEIEVLDNGEGKPVVIVDPDKEKTAQDQATFGCGICDEPLETAFGTECALA